MHYLLFAAQLLALVGICRRGLLPDVPWFAASILLALPLTFGYDPASAGWIELYLRVEPILVSLRLLAAVQAVLRIIPREAEPWRTVISSWAVSGSLMALCWCAGGGPPLDFVNARRYLQIFTAFGMLLGLMLAWRRSSMFGWRWGMNQVHAVVLLLIVSNHAWVSLYRLHIVRWSWAEWTIAQPVSFGIASVLYAVWGIAILRVGGARAAGHIG